MATFIEKAGFIDITEKTTIKFLKTFRE